MSPAGDFSCLVLLYSIQWDMICQNMTARMCHNTALNTLPSRDAQQLIISGSNYLSMLSCYFFSHVNDDV